MGDVASIVREHLKYCGYGGLAGDQCGCDLEDLFACGCVAALGCFPAYKHIHSVTKEWIMNTFREHQSDEKIQEVLDAL
jgi:hypothetical protein